MKRILLLLSILYLISSCSKIDDRISTPENFSKTISNSFIQNDYEQYQEFILNSDDFDYLVETSVLSDEGKEKLLSHKSENINITRVQNKRKFSEIAPFFEKYSYSSCDYEISNDKTGSVYIDHLVINLQDEKKIDTKQIIFEFLVQTNRGWVINGFISEWNTSYIIN